MARWRYDQIADALPSILTRTGRAEIIRELAHRPVAWPNGDIAAIPRSTAYRWIRVYNQGGLEALRPAERKDKGKRRARLPDDVVERALDLWTQDSDAGFTFLIAQLEADPELRLAERGIRVAKSTLQRRLAEHELYGRLLRIRKKERRRTRYVARRPHDIWHLDAKGAVRVALVSGEVIEFHVLTILDDASRDTLAWIVVPSPNLAATVRVFRLAAKRWGLPKAVYLDRASVFDSHAFRGGLANLGAHRIRIRPRNPEANGKIEAYHRCLVRWFTKRLPKQRVVDLLHLQQLLDGMIETLYRDHTHREIGTSPRAALAGAVSSRLVPAPRLDDAFRTQLRKKAHRKTGEVDLPGGKFIVPEDLFGQRLDFLIDPEGSALPVVVHPTSERHLSLSRAAVRPEDAAAGPDPLDRHGDGPLQRIYDHWQGKVRPNAEPGFGLPELFALLGSIARRHVPNSDAEAARVQHVWLSVGPVPKKAAERAFRDIERELGPSRPLDIYLDALRERVESQQRRRK